MESAWNSTYDGIKNYFIKSLFHNFLQNFHRCQISKTQFENHRKKWSAVTSGVVIIFKKLKFWSKIFLDEFFEYVVLFNICLSDSSRMEALEFFLEFSPVPLNRSSDFDEIFFNRLRFFQGKNAGHSEIFLKFRESCHRLWSLKKLFFGSRKF